MKIRATTEFAAGSREPKFRPGSARDRAYSQALDRKNAAAVDADVRYVLDWLVKNDYLERFDRDAAPEA